MITNSLLALAFMYGSYRLSSWWTERQYLMNKHKIDMLHERDKQTYLFRQNMSYRFGLNVYECMPSYKEMANSNKPLTAAEWIDVDKLTSFDYEVGSELDFRPYQPIKKIFINPN